MPSAESMRFTVLNHEDDDNPVIARLARHVDVRRLLDGIWADAHDLIHYTVMDHKRSEASDGWTWQNRNRPGKEME